MKIYLLGSQGWIPGKNETCCLMIEDEKTLLFLDAGTGISNLIKYRDILGKYDSINIILSHYHLDHTIGLIYLLPYIEDKKLRIYGPGKNAYPNDTAYYVNSLLRKEFFARSIDNFTDDVKIFDYPSNEFVIGNLQIKVSEQRHTSPSFRVSINDKMIYATDTDFDLKEWARIKADVLFHECWVYEKLRKGGHSSLVDLKDYDFRNKFKNIYLIHQNPSWGEADYKVIHDMIKNTNINLANDGMIITI